MSAIVKRGDGPLAEVAKGQLMIRGARVALHRALCAKDLPVALRIRETERAKAVGRAISELAATLARGKELACDAGDLICDADIGRARLEVEERATRKKGRSKNGFTHETIPRVQKVAESRRAPLATVSDAVDQGVRAVLRKHDVPTTPAAIATMAKLAKKDPAIARQAIAKLGDVPSVGKAIAAVMAASRKKAESRAIKDSGKRPSIQSCEARDLLDSIADESIDLLLTDPPYSTDVDLATFIPTWLSRALSKVKPTGRAYVCVGAYPQELLAYLSAHSWSQVLVWTYRNTLGPSPKLDYKLNWQAILYWHGPQAAPLDVLNMNEQFSVQDISAPDGRQGDHHHAWQKPDELAERLVRHATKPGDTVLDLFAGTGTFMLAASKLDRIAIGCERDPEMQKIARSRGCLIAKGKSTAA